MSVEREANVILNPTAAGFTEALARPQLWPLTLVVVGVVMSAVWTYFLGSLIVRLIG